MDKEGLRIAKFIAGNGVCSRRKAEELISQGLVTVNGELITNPATHVTDKDIVKVEGKLTEPKQDKPRIWLYYKPNGLITTHSDTHNRPTVFENLPDYLPRVISIGRLDLNSEGLLILTNSSKISRFFELPKNEFTRLYKVRAFGAIDIAKLKQIEQGIIIDSVQYKPAKIKLIKENQNSWFEITLTEGKNREIRKIFEHFGLKVNRLIRIKYGPFELKQLQPGEIYEVPYKDIIDLLPNQLFFS